MGTESTKAGVKLAVCIPFMNQIALMESVLTQLNKVTSQDVPFILINNGSDANGYIFKSLGRRDHQNIWNKKSIGVYPTFKQAFEKDTFNSEILAFFHSDLAVWEKDWDIRVKDEFDKNPKLGMIGFIGSNEIDSSGGRGLGTISNFQGKALVSADVIGRSGIGSQDLANVKIWAGSPAEAHGKRSDGFTKASVVDGCAMIIRASAFKDIGHRENFPPHHFYDRLISTQLLEKGWEIGVLGIEFDHISGQTVNQEPKYQEMAYNWLKENRNIAGDFNPEYNYDMPMYIEAEKMWLEEYRRKGLIPHKV